MHGYGNVIAVVFFHTVELLLNCIAVHKSRTQKRIKRIGTFTFIFMGYIH